MAAKAWATGGDKKTVDEIFFRNDAVSLCLLVNRRAKVMRVVDFRAGPTPAKRMFVLSLARREGVEKLFTVVERDEVSTWVKLGFTKEGNIPGFYKRSDAFLLGCSVSGEAGNGVSPVSSVSPVSRSGVRVAVRSSRAPTLAKVMTRMVTRAAEVSLADRYLPGNGAPVWADPEPDADTVDAALEPIDTTAQDFAEKTLLKGKRIAKELLERGFVPVKVAAIQEADAKKAVASALRSGRALTGFEPFGRDVSRRYFSLTARGGFELVASAESQACFGNAFLELLCPPRNEAERLATASALHVLCGRLLADGVVSCFALAPSDDVDLAAAFAANGFRRTGVLPGHLVVGAGARKDAIVFVRKLANPADE